MSTSPDCELGTTRQTLGQEFMREVEGELDMFYSRQIFSIVITVKGGESFPSNDSTKMSHFTTLM